MTTLLTLERTCFEKCHIYATLPGLLLNLKKTGSVSYDIKLKSLLECWLTPCWKTVEDDDTDGNPHLKFIQRNVHIIKLEIQDGKCTRARKAVENYHALATYTKTYNKWYLCEKGEQTWKKGMYEGQYRMLVRIIKLDQLMGKYKYSKPVR